MDTAPALLVTVHRFAAWRALVVALAAAAAASFAAWLALHAQSATPGLIAGAAAAAAAFAACRASRRQPVSLRWDGTNWRLGPAEVAPDELPCGRLLVAIDAGSFLLLRFEDDDGANVQWLPVQRAGIEARWHALRRAVYSPRPAAPEPTDDPLSPA